MTTPEEIAREIIHKWWGLPDYIKTPPPEYERLVGAIAAALAASEQRGKDAEGCGPHHTYRGTPVDCEEYETIAETARTKVRAQLQASERALERVKKESLFFAEKWRWFLKDRGKFHQAFLADVAALASPGSPQEQ